MYLKKLVCLLALTGIFHAPLQAHDKNFGYLHDKNADLILNSLGECIRTTSWTAEAAIPECEGVEEKMVADADQDGVADSSDKCPATPAGVMVDARGCEKDSDKDGIADSADKCPATASGVMVDASGCAKDSDKDGVIDSADKCPGTAAGAAVDASGCVTVMAPKDTDNDGIADKDDKCPNSKPGVTIDASGCELQKSFVLVGVGFLTGSDELTVTSKSRLDKVAETMAKNPELKIEVAGYTDDRGEADFNQSLSQKRAESVKAYLVSAGVQASRMTAKGYGEAKPVADNSTAEGRARNRRVEIHTL